MCLYNSVIKADMNSQYDSSNERIRGLCFRQIDEFIKVFGRNIIFDCYRGIYTGQRGMVTISVVETAR